MSKEAERRELEAAGWEAVAHLGDVVWRNPKSRFLYPRSMALRLAREKASAGGDDGRDDEGLA